MTLKVTGTWLLDDVEIPPQAITTDGWGLGHRLRVDFALAGRRGSMLVYREIAENEHGKTEPVYSNPVYVDADGWCYHERKKAAAPKDGGQV